MPRIVHKVFGLLDQGSPHIAGASQWPDYRRGKRRGSEAHLVVAL